MEPKKDEDKILMRKLKEDDEKAFRAIYLKYHQELFTVAMKYLRSENLAEDAVHDIFVKLWDSRETLEKSGSLSGFLFTAIKNHVLNMVNAQKRKLQKEVELKQEKSRDEHSSDHKINVTEFQEVYKEAIDKLPSARRKVYELRIKEGLTNEEVADYQGISINTVKSQFYKASKFIREYIKEHAPIDNSS